MVPQPLKSDRWYASHIFLVDAGKKYFNQFIPNVFRQNKVLFYNYNINPQNCDRFYIEYLKDNIQYKSFTHDLKMILSLFHGQADVKPGFSLNKKLIVGNMSEESEDAQQFLKDHMLLNDYDPCNILIAEELKHLNGVENTQMLLTKKP